MLWKKNKANLTLVCDIGSATVSLAIVQITNIKPVILYTTIVPIKVDEVYEPSKLEANLLVFFAEAIKNVSAAFRSELRTLSEKQIHDAVLVFSSPWYVAKTRSVSIEKSTPFFLDAHTIEDLINSEERKFEEEALSGSLDVIGNRDVRMIERELVRVKLNGYETANPYLKRVQYAELSLYMSLVPHDMLKTMTDLLADRLHIGKTKAYTFPLVSFGAIRKLFPHESNYLLLDVAGEMTDVSCIQERIITGSKAFPTGRNALIREVAKNMHVSNEIALSHLIMYGNNALEEKVTKELQYILDTFFGNWKKEFTKVTRALDSNNNQNSRVFLSINGDVSGLFLQNLHNVSAIDEHDAVFLSDEVLGNNVAYGKHVETDPFIGIETLFIVASLQEK